MKPLSQRLDVLYDNLIDTFKCCHDAIKSFVEKRQGSDGFLMIDEEDYDHAYALVWDGDYYTYAEYPIIAIRVKNDKIQILYDSPNTKWTTEDVANAMNDEDMWFDIYNDCDIYYYPTLINILEVLTGYENDD